MRWVGRIVAGLALLVLFLVAVVAAALIHLDTTTGRDLVVRETNAALRSSFAGTTTVQHVRGIGLSGLRGVDATVVDPSGRRVLAVRGATVRIATGRVLSSVLAGNREPIAIDVTGVTTDSLDISLDSDGDGHLALADAFAPRRPHAAPPPGAPPSRDLDLRIEHIHLVEAHVTGRIGGAPVIDADVADLRGDFAKHPDAIVVDVAGVGLVAHGIANGADVAGELRGHARLPEAPDARPDLSLAWEGRAGDVSAAIRASFTNDVVDASVDVPEATPRQVRTLWPAAPFDRPARLHLGVQGPLTSLDATLRAALGDAVFDARGRGAVEGEREARLDFSANAVDLHELAPSVPRSRLALRGELNAHERHDGALDADVSIRFLGGRLGTTDVPCASIHATMVRAASGGTPSAKVDLAVDQPGAPTSLQAELLPRAGAPVVTFHLESKVDDFQRIPQLGHGTSGSASLDAGGRVDLGARSLEAHLRADAHDLTRGRDKAKTVTLEASARGPIANPWVDAAVHGASFEVGGLALTTAELRAVGAVMHPHVTASVRSPSTPDVDARADVGLQRGVTLSSVHVDLARAGQRGTVDARRVQIGSTIAVDDARIEGFGAPLTASGSAGRGTLILRAETQGIDLGRVARLARMEKRLSSGILKLDADLRLRHASGEGRLALDANDLTMGAVKDVSAHVDVALKGNTVDGVIDANAKAIGALEAKLQNVTVGRAGPLSSSGWKQAFGTLDVAAHADLAQLATLLPLAEARGKVTLELDASRRSAVDPHPALHAKVKTEGLALAGSVHTERDIDGVLVFPLPRWHIEGVDFDVDGGLDAGDGLAITARARDARDVIANLQVESSRFPVGVAVNDPARLAAVLRTTDFDVHVSVPERGLGTLPAILRQRYVSGRFRADVTMRGSVDSPTLDASASLRHAVFSASKPGAVLDLDLVARYGGHHGTASVKARSADRQLLDVQADLDVAVASLMGARSGSNAPWTASAKAHLDGFPLQSIAMLDDKGVSGSVTGDLSLSGLHEDARLDGRLSVDRPTVGSFAYKAAAMSVHADGTVVQGRVRLDQDDGFGEANVRGDARWGAAIAPSLDPSSPLDVTLSAKNLRIAVLRPFVAALFDELDGRVDASTKVELDPRSKTAKMEGNIELSRGTFEAVAGGGELHDVAAKVKLAPDGTVTLEKLTARGLDGRLEATGTARLNGTTLQSAHAVVSIPSNAAIPMTASGTDLGDVNGRIDVTAATSAGHGLNVKVDVPNLGVKLPQALTVSPRSLGTMENVRIGAHRGHPMKFVILPLDPQRRVEAPPSGSASGTALVVAAHLGEVHVVRGTQIKVDLGGDVEVKSGRVTGQIHLKRGGTLDVQGRLFTVDSGTVSFVGPDPSDPQIVVKAGWTAPDGTVVYATFTGPLKTGKVTLSSVPPMPQEEIVQLLLFGSADGKQLQSPGASTETSALVTAGGEAAQPLNHMLNQLGLGAVTAKVDTSGAATPKPEVEVQIARDISLQLAVVLGQPPPGVNPDRTLVTLDWRFLSRWSLATTVGDAGTTIFDLLWQKRY